MLPLQKKYQGGFGLIEVLVAVSVLTAALLGISYFFQTALSTSNATRAQVQSGYLLEEGVEALKLLRDTSYSANIGKLSTTTPTYLVWSTNRWATTSAKVLIDGKYERKIVAGDVLRDGTTYDIAPTGIYDPNTKLVTVTVSWVDAKGATSTRSISTYILNLFNN